MSTPVQDPRLPNPYNDIDPAIRAQFVPGGFWARSLVRFNELFRDILLKISKNINSGAFVLIATDSNLAGGRALTGGANVSVTDNGAGSTVVVAVVPPTGSGFPHVTGGALDAAARAIDLSTADATGIIAAARLPDAISERTEFLTPASNAGVTINWAIGASVVTVNGTNALTFSNVAATGNLATHSIYTTVFNSVTWPAAVTWGLGGIPSIAGGAWISLVSSNGGTNVFASVFWRAN